MQISGKEAIYGARGSKRRIIPCVLGLLPFYAKIPQEKEVYATMATAKKQKTKKILVLKSGEEFEVLCDKGKYFNCGNTQFRKSNPAILKVETRNDAKAETEAENNADH